MYHALPAGLQQANYSLFSTVTVYDVLGCNVSAAQSVAVYPMDRSNSSTLHSVLLSRLESSNVSVDAIKSATTLVSSILKSVDCSLSDPKTQSHKTNTQHSRIVIAMLHDILPFSLKHITICHSSRFFILPITRSKT